MSSDNPDIQQLVISAEQRTTSRPRFAWPMLALFSIAILAWFYLASTAPQAKQPQALVASQAVKPAQDLSDTANSNPATAVPATAVPATTEKESNQAGNASVLDASGHIVARRIATVSSRVTGKLESLHIEEGQKVKRLELLAQLDDQQAQIALDLAQAELAATQAGLAELKLVQAHELQRLKRKRQLARQQLLSEQLIDDVQSKTQRIAAQLKNKQALLELAQKRVELAQYQVAQHQIKAPFDGVVISKNAQVGELISAGNSGGGFIRTGVGTIVDMSSLEIEVEVGESYINRVRQGQTVKATLDAYPDWQIKSEVITVIPTADRQKASIKVRIRLLERDDRILPDMGVKVSFLS